MRMHNFWLYMAAPAILLLTACAPVQPAPPAPPAARARAIILDELELITADRSLAPRATAGPGSPAFARALERVYGPPSQEAFGSAVFFEPETGDAELAKLALAKYRYFVGDLWERFGEQAWLGPWRQVYSRPAGATAGIVVELGAITDRVVALTAPLILDNVADPAATRAALAAAFDDPIVNELGVFTLGDGEVISGILVAGRRGDTGEAVFLVFLLD